MIYKKESNESTGKKAEESPYFSFEKAAKPSARRTALRTALRILLYIGAAEKVRVWRSFRFEILYTIIYMYCRKSSAFSPRKEDGLQYYYIYVFCRIF